MGDGGSAFRNSNFEFFRPLTPPLTPFSQIGDGRWGRGCELLVTRNASPVTNDQSFRVLCALGLRSLSEGGSAATKIPYPSSRDKSKIKHPKSTILNASWSHPGRSGWRPRRGQKSPARRHRFCSREAGRFAKGKPDRSPKRPACFRPQMGDFGTNKKGRMPPPRSGPRSSASPSSWLGEPPPPIPTDFRPGFPGNPRVPSKLLRGGL